jgi:transcriptional regulator with XRE-family HTH domain
MPRIPIDTENRISIPFKKRLLELMDDLEIENNVKSEFAKLVGVSTPVIMHATIHGIIPSLRPLIKIADFLNVSLEYLLGETDVNDFYKSETPTTFHARLETLSKEKNVKYSTIAKTMPFTKNFFYQWQREKTLPCLDYLKPLAEYFGVSPDYLLGRTDDRN